MEENEKRESEDPSNASAREHERDSRSEHVDTRHVDSGQVDNGQVDAQRVDPLAQRRAFLRRLSSLGLLHVAIRYVGNDPSAQVSKPVQSHACGSYAHGSLVEDKGCGSTPAGAAGPQKDADCGKPTQLTAVAAASTDNACGQFGADGLRESDGDCGKTAGGGLPHVDQDCGFLSGAPGGATMSDNQCGMLIGGASGVATTDGDCGSSLGMGSAQNDNDCGKSMGGGAAHSDTDCGLAFGIGKWVDNDCGKPARTGVYTDQS